MGHMYSNGTVIDSLGGGVCQVSSTLYNAALFADIKITERRCHSSRRRLSSGGPRCHRRVGLPGLQVQEQHRRPDLTLAAKTRGGVLTFRIYGTAAPKRKIERIRVSGGSSGRSGGTYYSAWKVGKDENGKRLQGNDRRQLLHPAQAAQSAKLQNNRPGSGGAEASRSLCFSSAPGKPFGPSPSTRFCNRFASRVNRGSTCLFPTARLSAHLLPMITANFFARVRAVYTRLRWSIM